jgi:hypothetical protein
MGLPATNTLAFFYELLADDEKEVLYRRHRLIFAQASAKTTKQNKIFSRPTLIADFNFFFFLKA